LLFAAGLLCIAAAGITVSMQILPLMLLPLSPPPPLLLLLLGTWG
jgi:hypothetical protein